MPKQSDTLKKNYAERISYAIDREDTQALHEAFASMVSNYFDVAELIVDERYFSPYEIGLLELAFDYWRLKRNSQATREYAQAEYERGKTDASKWAIGECTTPQDST